MMIHSNKGLESQFTAWAGKLAKNELQLNGLKNKLDDENLMTRLSKELSAIKVEVNCSIESAKDAFSFSKDADLFNAIYKQIVEYVEQLLALVEQMLAVASHIGMPEIKQAKSRLN